MNSVTMPFGKYIGRDLSDVPPGYLLWLTTIELQTWLREAVEAEIAFRQESCQPVRSGRSRARSRIQAGPRLTPEQVADAALQLVNGTPAALMFGQVARLLVDAEVTAEDYPESIVDNRRDLDMIAGRLQVVRSSLIDIARASKRLTARRAAAVANMDATAAA